MCLIVDGSPTHLAQISREAGQTQALEAVHFILTASAVQARRARTFVNVPLAVLARKAGWADTTIAVHQVLIGRNQGERHAATNVSNWSKH